MKPKVATRVLKHLKELDYDVDRESLSNIVSRFEREVWEEENPGRLHEGGSTRQFVDKYHQLLDRVEEIETKLKDF
jgi:hypothetical protein